MTIEHVRELWPYVLLDVELICARHRTEASNDMHVNWTHAHTRMLNMLVDWECVRGDPGLFHIKSNVTAHTFHQWWIAE